VAGLGNLIQKAKAMIPKVVSAGKQAVKTVVNKVADSAIGKAVKAVPQALRAGIEKRVEFTKKVAASVPKAIESVKKKAEETAGKVKAKAEEVKAKAEEVKESVTKKIQEVTTDINQRNERILDKVKAEWEKTSSGLIRGFTTTGAICPTVWQVRSSSLMLDFMLQTRKAVIEEYPIFNRQSSFLKDLIHTIETGVSDGGAKAGSFIYNLNLPGVSDFVGAFTGQREPDAMSNTFSMRGAFCRGLLVDGLLGTVDGVANLIADPFEAMEGLNTIMLYPEVTLPAIGNGIKTYFKEKILDGSPDDWAQASGQVTFEVISFLAGVGEAKTGTKAAKAAKAVKAGEIVEDSSQMTRTVLKLMDKAADSGKAAKYLNVPALKNLGKKVLKNLDDLVVNTGKRTGDFIDNVRMGMNRLSGPVPEYAGVGQLDDIGRTGEKIEDLLSAFKNKFMKAEKPPESGVGIFTKTNEEKVGKLIDNLPDKSAAKGSGKIAQQEIDALKKTVIDEGQILKDMGLNNKELGPAIAGAYDSKTGKTYTAINEMHGALPDELHPILKERIMNMPPEVLDSYMYTHGAGSHAEIYAANKALLANPDANISDITIYVNRTLGTTKPVIEIPFQTCPHCEYILRGFNIISDIK
jgi:hypothetical protein